MEKEKTVAVEIELNIFTREDLENLIINSHEKNMTINEYVVHCLTEYFKNNPVPEEK